MEDEVKLFIVVLILLMVFLGGLMRPVRNHHRRGRVRL